jgi:hypothetical protein
VPERIRDGPEVIGGVANSSGDADTPLIRPAQRVLHSREEAARAGEGE